MQYERFVNEVLRKDLKKVLDDRDAIYSNTAEFLQLKSIIERMNEQKGFGEKQQLKTMVDLGCNVYAQAKVKDSSRIFVAVGLGFYLEMALEEALVFVDERTTELSARGKELTEQASQINARIKIVLEGLRELQFGTQTQEAEQRTVW